MRSTPLLLLALIACDGVIGEPFTRPSSDAPTVIENKPGRAPLLSVGPRRLTAEELDATLVVTLGLTSHPAVGLIPSEPGNVFDTTAAAQLVSDRLITRAEQLAELAAADAVASPTFMATVVGCPTAAPTDRACMSRFVERAGLLLFRAPLEADEAAAFTDFGMQWAATDSAFRAGVELVLRAMLQHPKFLYQIERDARGPTSPYEVATRLSLLFWGSGPDDELLALAATDALKTPDQLRAAAERLLASPRAAAQVQRFTAQWLGYATLASAGPLPAAMKRQADELVAQVLVTNAAPLGALLAETSSSMNDTVGALYGMTAPAQWGRVTLPAARPGILGTPAFFTVGLKGADSSPTLRGRHVRERLLCQTIGAPPPGVITDVAPSAGTPACKIDRYAAHRTQGSTCQGCHAQMDPIGFGLENYDPQGRYRAFDDSSGTANPACPIDGKGKLEGFGGDFTGPAGLSRLLAGAPQLEACAAQHFVAFAAGVEPTAFPAQTGEAVAAAARTGQGRFVDLMLAAAALPGFAAPNPEATP